MINGNGLKIQWGRKQFSSTSVTAISFPIQFTISKPIVIGTPARESSDGTPQGDIRIRKIDGTQFDAQVTNSSSYTTGAYFHWIAIGY